VTDDEDENKVIEFLKSKSYIIFVTRKLFDRVNIDANICLPEFQELHGTLKEIKTNPLIKDLIVRFWLKTSNLGYPENLVMTDSSNKIDIEYKQKLDLEKKVELDEMDRRVAKILAQNSRVPFTKIAQELNISNKNVIQRYRKLRGSVLTQSTITIDLKKLGYTMMVFLKLEVADKSQINKIANKLLQIPNVITVIELAGGDYDLFPNIVLRNCNELFRLKDQLNEIQGVKKTTVLLFEPHESFPFNMFASLL